MSIEFSEITPETTLSSMLAKDSRLTELMDGPTPNLITKKTLQVQHVAGQRGLSFLPSSFLSLSVQVTLVWVGKLGHNSEGIGGPAEDVEAKKGKLGLCCFN